MSSEDENNGIYFTSQKDLEKSRMTKNNGDRKTDDFILEYETYTYDGPHLLYKEYTLREREQEEHVQSRNEEDIPIPEETISYDESLGSEDLHPLSRECSMKEEYLLSMPSRKDEPKDSLPETSGSKPNRPVVQDNYDEDNYCLARTSGFGPHDNIRAVDLEQTENDDNNI